MEQYKEGTVFSLYEDSDDDYIVLKTLNLDNKIYLIVCPVTGEKENLKMDTSKLVLINVDEKTNDIEFVKDEEIIGKAIDMAFEL